MIASRLTAGLAVLLGTASPIVAPGQQEPPRPPSEEGILEIEGARLAYRTFGEGVPVVVLHGGPGLDSSYLLPQMAELADGFRLIFYDQRTSGDSSSEVEVSEVTLDHFVEDLEKLRQGLRLGRMNLLGHSWGGMLAMFYAIEHPENLGSLVLLSSGGARSTFWAELFDGIDRGRTPESAARLKQLQESPGFASNDPAVLEQYYQAFFEPYFHDQAMARRLSTRLDADTLLRMDALYQSPLNRSARSYDIVAELSKIQAPTLIVHGENDVIPVAYAEEIHDAIEGSDLLILGRCGHFPYIEQPEKTFAAITGFLRTVASN
ncbi:MAG TPA: alpha/beta fold hydrolase [Thermoanaerobaculia bacterium]|nr:alpha/beta fold hydrolase [Thermoanaerobaculia bacterium]